MPAPIAKPMSLSGSIRAAEQSGRTPPREMMRAAALREMLPPGSGNALMGAGASNALTSAGAAPAPAPVASQARNAQAGAGLAANPVMAPPSASPGPANALTAAAGGPAPAPAPMPPQATPMPPPAPQAPPSPNPQLDQVAQQAAAANLSPADMEAAKQRASFVMHNLAPLARQPGEITPGDLLRVSNQAVKSGMIPADQARAFVTGLPTDQAGIRQALTDRVKTAVLTSIHLAGATAASGSPQQPAPTGSN